MINVEKWAAYGQPHTNAMQTLLDKHIPSEGHHSDVLGFICACNSIGILEKECLAFILANQDRISAESSYHNNPGKIEALVDDLYDRYADSHGAYKIEAEQKGAAAEEEMDYEVILESARIDVREELPPPPVCLSILQGEHQITTGTLGNFAMIIGKAKSRKTFFVTMLLAAWIRNGLVLGKVQGNLPSSRRTVLHFDTEQGKFHVQRTAKRALKLAGGEMSDHYRAYGLRRFAPSERLGVIEHAVYSDDTVGVVVIDGIRDLATLGINNEEEATTLTSKLLKWTEERQIHIVVILHQNKNDANARGHLGTELVNKAETVLSITKEEKNRDMSVVAAEYCRDKDPEPFGFSIGAEGIPELVEQWEIKAEKYSTQKGITPLSIPPDIHREALKRAFAKDQKLRYNELKTQLKLAFECLGPQLSDNTVKACIVQYKNESLLRQEGKEGTINCKYSLEENGLTGLV